MVLEKLYLCFAYSSTDKTLWTSNMEADPLLFPYTEMHIFHGVCPMKQQIMVFKSTRAPVKKRFC